MKWESPLITVCSTESEVMTRVGLGVDRARPSSTESVGPHRTHLVERVSTQLVKTKSIIGLTYIHNNNAFANLLPTRNSQVCRLAAQKQNQNKPPCPKKSKTEQQKLNQRNWFSRRLQFSRVCTNKWNFGIVQRIERKTGFRALKSRRSKAFQSDAQFSSGWHWQVSRRWCCEMFCKWDADFFRFVGISWG